MTVSGVGPAWLWLPALLVGAGAGGLVARWLRSAGYRLQDERDRPVRAVGWVVPVTGLLWATLAWRLGAGELRAYLPVALFLATVGVALTAVDLDVHRLPERLTLPSYPVVILLLVVASAVTGLWRPLLVALVAGAVSVVVYFLLFVLAALTSPGGLGFGDVVLSGIIGLALGWLGAGLALFALLAAFLVAGVAALGLVLTRRATRQTRIAFGPFMLVGAWLTVILAPGVAVLF
ncbi:MAG TPA: A24 family peptidase [Dermatophilaceae bacterium]|nr:A24 family peptidase [Dermatophilaceae bacterium]